MSTAVVHMLRLPSEISNHRRADTSVCRFEDLATGSSAVAIALRSERTSEVNDNRCRCVVCHIHDLHGLLRHSAYSFALTWFTQRLDDKYRIGDSVLNVEYG